MARKITVFTGTRAEYGLLFPLMKAIHDHSNFDLSLIVSGSHLSPHHGYTVQQILEDGWQPDFLIDLNIHHDDPLSILGAMSRGLEPYGHALKKINPEAVVILGDRYEAFVMAQAAYLLQIPIIHLHGGETTAGATDEAFRHGITKMAYWHFASAEPYRKRIIQLGEDPNRVFQVGALGLDSIRLLPKLPEPDLRAELGLPLEVDYLVATYHPETLSSISSLDLTRQFYQAFESFPNLHVVLTLPNADAEGLSLIDFWQQVGKVDPRFHVFASLGGKRYFSAVRYAKAVVGNSSSGIIEVPSLGVPTINVGDRQKGRLMSPSIIQTDTQAESIQGAIEKVLGSYSVPFVESLYGDGFATERILTQLEKWPEHPNLAKTFFDV
ncbi:MAG: UDP-N-acetylglucosamine 2-epimerase [Spirosomataceae bacterium]